MLATPIPYESDYPELASQTWLVEDKFDGIRAQVHKHGGDVLIFSRTHNDVAAAFPEVVAAAGAIGGDVILDGEIVARREGRTLPFRYLQTRLQRKVVDEALRQQTPVAFVAFDLLADGAETIVDEPLSERRRRLEERLLGAPAIEVAAAASLGGAPDAAAVRERFAAARARGNEGLVFKRLDAPYMPGRRGKWWLKLKRELSTIDAIVVGVEWGHGKRNAVLSDYTFAVRRPDDGRLLVIGKAYTGLTDVEIAEMTRWFLAHRTGTLGRHAIAVEPSVVVEIAFDIIQPSTLHDSGYSLRFPRIVRLRPDKPAAEADTIADVERIYAEMLEREGVSY
jgi:DNA ligase-1